MTLLGQTLSGHQYLYIHKIEQNRRGKFPRINGLIFLFLLIVCYEKLAFQRKVVLHTMKVIALSNDNDRRFIGFRRGRIENSSYMYAIPYTYNTQKSLLIM